MFLSRTRSRQKKESMLLSFYVVFVTPTNHSRRSFCFAVVVTPSWLFYFSFTHCQEERKENETECCAFALLLTVGRFSPPQKCGQFPLVLIKEEKHEEKTSVCPNQKSIDSTFSTFLPPFSFHFQGNFKRSPTQNTSTHQSKQNKDSPIFLNQSSFTIFRFGGTWKLRWKICVNFRVSFQLQSRIVSLSQSH